MKPEYGDFIKCFAHALRTRVPSIQVEHLCSGVNGVQEPSAAIIFPHPIKKVFREKLIAKASQSIQE